MYEKEKKRILFIITGLETGGAEVLLLRHCRYLKKKNTFDFRVISLTGLGPIGEIMSDEGFDVVSVNESGKYNFKMIWRLYKEIKIYKPDIIHDHLFHANVFSRIFGWYFRIPKVISTIHNENIGGKLREVFMRFTDSLSTKTVVIAKSVADILLEKKVVSRKSLVVIQNGIDTTEFAAATSEEKKILRNKLNVPESTLVFIAVGRLEEQKGYKFLLESIKEIVTVKENILIFILGDGSQKDELVRMAEELKISQDIRWLGNKNNVKDYFQVSDIYVLPSLWEGLPIALLEAMSCALPVVATEVGSVGAVVDSGKSGFLVRTGDSRLFAEGIKKAIDLGEKGRLEFGQYGRRKMISSFSQEMMFQQYDGLYV